MAPMQYSTRLQLRNSTSQLLNVYFEPWGDLITVSAGDEYEARFSSPIDDCVCIEHADTHLAVWGWAGSTLLVTKGSDVVMRYDVAVPDGTTAK